MSNQTNIDREEAYGSAELSPTKEVTAGSYKTWALKYTVGQLGMDDGSRLQIAWQGGDIGTPQFSHPTEDNYATASTTGNAVVEAHFDSLGYIRPWKPTVTIDIHDGYLKKGDEILVTLGDTTQGSMGHRAQTFVEDEFAFLVLPDPLGTGDPIELDKLAFDIIPGPANSLKAVAPSSLKPGETASISIRAEDYWGNLSEDYSGTLSVEAEREHQELNEQGDASNGIAEVDVEISDPGIYRFIVTDTENELETETNPVRVEDDLDNHVFWGDLHGQSEETVGTGSIQDYFEYAKECAFLDFSSHAGNDFQITDKFWDEIRATIQDFHTPGEFVTFLCYEWSANTANGGDHNVYFKRNNGELHRSSKWLIADDEEKHEGTYPIENLYEKFDDRDDVLIIPHQGGRPANLDNLNPERTPFIEIASAWGWFEWFGEEALNRGYHVGFVGGSDDHSGRPGVSYPTNRENFNVKGSLMGVKAESLSRDALWDSFNEKRCYATTGERILLDVSIEGENMGSEVNTESSDIDINVHVNGTDNLEQIDLFRDGEVAHTKRFGIAEHEPEDKRIELMWSGIGSKGRYKTQDWSGGARLDEGELMDVEQFGFDHPEKGIKAVTDQSVKWSGATAGDYQGIRLNIAASKDARLYFNTPPIRTSYSIGELSEPQIIEGDQFDQKLQIQPYSGSSTKDTSLEITDKDIPSGRHFYYVRVRQENGSMAWSSPILVHK